MIRFRAWDKVAKVIIYNIEQTYDGLGYFKENEDIEDYVSNISFECFSDWLENEQFVIMQSTGLLDKNGREIFEGDILYFEPYETHGNDRVVEYIDGAYRGRLIRNGHSKLLAECVYETKIIGNIYENPDLLESVEE